MTQLRDLAAGREPERVTPFADLLVTEIRRLASAHRAAERAARLQQVTAALAQTRTPEDVAAVVVTEGVEVLGASGGGLLVPAADGRHLAVPGAVGYEGGLVHALREELIDAPLPAATALRTGQAVWLESREERDRDFPALRGFEASTVSMCAVPLSVAGQVLGALRFSFDERRLFDQDERGFVLALAAQTAQTLQRTELYQAERRAAVDLQRALLPADIPRIPGWDVATHYSPAGDQEAGGDFYDVMEVAGGRYVAVVGDVMGRGLDAAASMAQVRSTVRAYAVEDPDPVTVFRRVDAFFACDPARAARDHGLPADRPVGGHGAAGQRRPPAALAGGGRRRPGGGDNGRAAVRRRPARSPRPGPEPRPGRLPGADHGRAGGAARRGHRRGHRPGAGRRRRVLGHPRRRAARARSSRPPSTAVTTTTSRCWCSAEPDSSAARRDHELLGRLLGRRSGRPCRKPPGARYLWEWKEERAPPSFVSGGGVPVVRDPARSAAALRAAGTSCGVRSPVGCQSSFS